MPIFAILCHDRPDAGTLRADTRSRHLEHVRALSDRVVRAGPFDDEAGRPCGSLILAEFADLAEARAFADADPYAQAGLFADRHVLAWRQVLP